VKGIPSGRGIRYSPIDGWEMFCLACREWWPLDLEFWYPKHGTGRCIACIRTAQRAKYRVSRITRTPEQAARARRYQEQYRLVAAETKREYNRRYREAHRDELNDRQRAYYQRTRDVRLAKARERYEREGEAIKAAQRLRYQGRKAA
jgi:hypothetical protein